MRFLDVAAVATILVLIYAIVGGVVVIEGNLSFKEYLESMTVAAGGLAIGRGLAARRNPA